MATGRWAGGKMSVPFGNVDFSTKVLENLNAHQDGSYDLSLHGICSRAPLISIDWNALV